MPLNGASDMAIDTPRTSFSVLDYVNAIRFKHGIKSEEYGRFHAYCSKRLGILRKQLRPFAIKSNKYVKEEFPEVINDARYFEILALRSERAWSHGMLLKSQCETSQTSGSNARHHYVKRFEKARKIAVQMEELCQKFAEVNSINNARVYKSLMEGIVHFENKRYQEAFTCLSAYANVMDQRKRINQDNKALAEAYASQLGQVNAIIKLCSFHMRVSGTKSTTRPVARDEDQNAELLSIVAEADGHLTLYCRGAPLEISSQFLLQQLLDMINSLGRLIVSDETLSVLLDKEHIGDAIKTDLMGKVTKESLIASYEDVMVLIGECTDTIHSEMMSSIYDQEPFRRLEDAVMFIKNFLEMEKCAIMEIMTLYNLFLSKEQFYGDVALPDCGEAIRFAQMLKQQLAIVMKDNKIASLLVMPLEVTKTVNGLLFGMHKIACEEYDDGMALVNWAYARQRKSVGRPEKHLTRLIWRLVVCFQILHRAGYLCSQRYYKRSVAIFARKKFIKDVEATGKPDVCKIFGLEKTLLPCKPIIFDLAYIHNQPPDLSQKTTIIGGVRSMFSSLWK